MKVYEVKVKLGLDYSKINLHDVLRDFELIYVPDGDKIKMYLKTGADPRMVRTVFDIKEAQEPPLGEWLAEVRLASERSFYSKIEYHALLNTIKELQPGQSLRIWVTLDRNLNNLLLNRAEALKRSQSRVNQVQASVLESYAKGRIYLIKLAVADDNKTRALQTARAIGSSVVYPAYGGIQVRLYRVIKDEWSLKKKVWEWLWNWRTVRRDLPPRVGFYESTFDYHTWLWGDENDVKTLLEIPEAGVFPVEVSSLGLLPTLIPNRQGFRVGINPDTGKEVRLEAEDLYRHMYVIGGTGAGKTSFLATLITRFLKTYPESMVVVIDPNGEFAEQLASSMADYEKLIYVDPVEVTVSVNPLSIPEGIKKDQALLLAESNVKEIFEQLFALKSSAVYVEYVITNAMKILYSKTRSPTFADLYNIIMKLRTGEIDIEVDDPTWEEKLKQFQELEETTYISALSRLEEYATNPLLKKLFGSDSIPNILEPGNLVIVNASNAQIGDKASFLMIAGWVYKLWYSVLIRKALRGKLFPVLTIIDEFEVISELAIIDIILSQARKFYMELVLAHQHLGQLDPKMLKSIFSNTAVKVLMRTVGEDAKALSDVDLAFKNEIMAILPKLEPGQAIMFVMPRKEGDPTTPFRVKFDYTDLKLDEAKLRQVIAKMKERYKATEAGTDNVVGLINPVLKYIDKPDPLEQRILFEAFKSSCEYKDSDGVKRVEHCIALVDLLPKLGIDRDTVEDKLNQLEAKGYVVVEKTKDRKKVVIYKKGLLLGLKNAAPSDEGLKLARAVALQYMKHRYYVAVAKQTGDARPDLVAIPLDANFKPHYSRSVAVEIESCNELSVHPEQVVHNWRKESVKDFSEVHSWTYAECFDKLQELYNQLSDEEKKKVKIFALKVKKQEQKPQEIQNQARLTGELTG